MPILTFQQISKLAILRQFYYLVWRLFGVSIDLFSTDRSESLVLGSENWSPFCVQLRRMGGETHCVDCDLLHLADAAEQGRSLRYRCWAGLREFVVPIMLEGEILAFIQCGQVLDCQPDEQDWQSTCLALKTHGVSALPAKELFFAQRVIPTQTQEDLVTLLELFGNYIAYAQYQILLAQSTQQSRIEERAVAFIRNHFTEPISLDIIAVAACTSKRNLTRVIQAATGTTVMGLIAELRIEKACSLLQAGEKNSAQIAYDCGFGSVQQFNRVFRKLRQATPQNWRLINSRGIENTPSPLIGDGVKS